MKIGCSAYINEYIYLCEAGFDYADLSLREIVRADAFAFRRLLGGVSGGIPIACSNAYCGEEIQMVGNGYSPERSREYAKLAAERAALLGIKCVGIGSPNSRIVPPEYPRRQVIEQMVEFCAQTAEIFGAAGIRVALEPLSIVYCNCVNTSGEALEIISAAGLSNLGLLADFYNFELDGDAEPNLSEYTQHIFHVHMSDDAGGPRRRDYLHMDKKERHTERIRHLKELEYDGTVSIEVDVPFTRSAAVRSLQLVQSAL